MKASASVIAVLFARASESLIVRSVRLQADRLILVNRLFPNDADFISVGLGFSRADQILFCLLIF